jgi:outer membrane protein with beta-barrel domain
MAIPIAAFGQGSSTNLGLPAVAAIGVHGGFARLERSSKGEEAGLLLDLGWLRGRGLRLQGEVSFLRASLTEYMALEDSTFSGNYYDLSAGATAVWLIAGDSRVSPYTLAGFAVHALSSTFQNSVLDQRYNANRFGSHIGAGLRVRLGSSRQALFAEARRVIADQVDRTVVRFGVVVLMNDLYHRSSVVR